MVAKPVPPLVTGTMLLYDVIAVELIVISPVTVCGLCGAKGVDPVR